MESKEDIIRVKQEPNVTWREAGDDYNFHSMNSCKVKTFETFESSANPTGEVKELHEKLDQKIFVDFECKDVKFEPKFFSTKIYKTEGPSNPPVVQIENQNQTNYLNEILNDFECKDVKPESKSLSTTICKTENQSYPPIVKIEKQLTQTYYTKLERGETYENKTHIRRLKSSILKMVIDWAIEHKDDAEDNEDVKNDAEDNEDDKDDA
ncbi:hypothetical protein TKK_0008544 [Trichogramma kaykai]